MIKVCKCFLSDSLLTEIYTYKVEGKADESGGIRENYTERIWYVS